MLESLLEIESRDDDEKYKVQYKPPVSSSHSVYCSTGPVQSVSLVPRTRAAAVPANEHISTLIPGGSDLLNTINQSTGTHRPWNLLLSGKYIAIHQMASPSKVAET